ncbi:MAG TPA: hypothetical protein VFI22_03215 [Thermomicrobiales bacterium]|nr:hypothetical protein [Thermomicrobiales bacterium]
MLATHPFWPWVSLALLGAFHGLNPAMGWLFAVARGLQERRLRGVLNALGPIVAGHAMAIGLVAIVVGFLGFVVPQSLLLALGGLALLGFAAWIVIRRFRHPRWVGMRVGPRQLMLWSFLMATAHGAGLMLIPVLVALRGEGVPSAVAAGGHAGHSMSHAAGGDATLLPALAAVGIHTAAMFAAAGLVAIVVYQKVGVEIVRRVWINLDFVWVGALAVAGGIALGFGLWAAVAG